MKKKKKIHLRFQDEAVMSGRSLTPCTTCKRRTGPETCTAFPAGIPRAIVCGGHDHRTPFEGDGGLTYLEDKEKLRAEEERMRRNDEILKQWKESLGE